MKKGRAKSRMGIFFSLSDGIKGLKNHNKIKSIITSFENYDKVIVRKMWSERIGEFVPQATLAFKEAVDNVNILYIYFLTDYERLNRAIYDSLIRQSPALIVPFNERTEYAFATAVSSKTIFEFDALGDQRFYSHYDIDVMFARQLFTLSDNQQRRCGALSGNMGINRPFVCFSNRDEVYMMETFGYCSTFRNSLFESRHLAIDYLLDNGIQSVRMGSKVLQSKIDTPYIQYAEKYHDEYMDLFLSQNCKFFCGDNSGVNALAHAYGKPCVATNDIGPHLDLYGGYVHPKLHLLIFKKFYSLKHNRFLNLKEMVGVQYNLPYDGGYSYEKQGVKLVDNTAEEIKDVVVEMNERIDGSWVETEMDIELQKMYWDIVENCLKQYDVNKKNIFKGKIGCAFLRNNPFLFDF